MLRFRRVGLRGVFGAATVFSMATGAYAQPNPTPAESVSYILPKHSTRPGYGRTDPRCDGGVRGARLSRSGEQGGAF